MVASSATGPDTGADEATAVLPEADKSGTEPASTSSAPARTRPGQLIGRYAVIDVVGEGAMGEVVRAYDPKLGREVALKRLRARVWGEEATARMIVEARAMARLSHPHVVSIFDVEVGGHGTGEEVVLAMEYVDGSTLGRWLDAESRDWKDIVRCFRQAGFGLAAAHAQDLLHRDFKPANVLVSRDGTAKVTDFGLAKITGDERDEPSRDTDVPTSSASSLELTGVGTVMGTPRYMAPEQHRGEALTPAADQYAFCVALWQALTGQSPFSSGDLAELLAAKDQGPPAWSSPHPVPRRIQSAVRRGLAPSPEARWPTMHALLEELDPAPGRLRTRVGAVAVAGALVTVGAWSLYRSPADALCTGAEQQLAEVWSPARRARVQEALAGSGSAFTSYVSTKITEELDAYAQQWSTTHTQACRATAVRQEQSSEVLDLRMGCLDRAKLQLGAAVATLEEADIEVARRADRVVAGLVPLERCDDTEALRAAVPPPLPDERAIVDELGRTIALSRAGRLAGKAGDQREAIEEAQRTAEGLDYEPIRTTVALEHGLVLADLGEYRAADEQLSAALEGATRWKQWPVARAAAVELMYVVGHDLGLPDEGLAYRDFVDGLTGDEPGAGAASLWTAATLLRDKGDLEAAESTARRALQKLEGSAGPDVRTVAKCRNVLAGVLAARGDPAAAEEQLRVALDELGEVLGPDHPDVGLGRSNLAAALWGQGKMEAAEAEFRGALAILEAALGDDHPNVAMGRQNLANVAFAKGDLEEAEALHRRGLAAWTSRLGPEHPTTAVGLSNLATVMHVQGRSGEATEALQRALKIMQAAHGPDHLDVALTHNNLGSVLEDRGRTQDAEPHYRRALEIRIARLDGEHPDVAHSRSALAGLLLALGRTEEATDLAEAAWPRRQQPDVPPTERAKTAFILARGLWETGRDRARARELATQAATDFGADTPEAAEAQRWLRDHGR